MKKNILFYTAAPLVLCLPWLIQSNYYSSLTAQAGVNALAALGLYLLFSRAGQISLGQAGFMALGAYGYILLHNKFGLSLALSLILPVIISLPVAYLIGLPLLRMRGHVLAMGTLAFGEMIYLSLRSFSFTGGPDGLSELNASELPASFWHVLTWVLVFAVVYMLNALKKSREGRALRVLHDDEELAASFGFSPAAAKTRLFIFSAALACTAGSLQSGMLGYAGPDLYQVHTSLMLLLMTVIAGAAHPALTVLSAAALTFLPEVLNFAEDWQLSIFAVILIFAVLRKNPFAFIQKKS